MGRRRSVTTDDNTGEDRQMGEEMKVCPKCKGGGTNSIHRHYAPGKGRSGWYTFPCRWCKGTGKVGPGVVARIAEGERMRVDRKARGMDAQAEAARLGITFDELISREVGLPEGVMYFDGLQ
jgi:DnaJ-class molecular chaperone